MEFFWFTYTIVLMAITTAAFAVNVTMWALASRRDSLAAAVGFLLYTLDTSSILFDEYQRTKPGVADYFETGLTQPVFQVVVGCLLVVAVWVWCAERSGVRARPAVVVVVAAAYLAASAVLAPVGNTSGPVRMMLYWGLRDVAIIVAAWWMLMGALQSGTPRRWYVVAMVLALLVLAEDARNILVSQPDLSTEWSRNLLWHLTERNLSENALVVLCAVASVVQVRWAVQVFARHPSKDEERLTSELVRPDLETRLLAFADEHGMSAREREVLELVLRGQDNQNIASALTISTGTVKAHLSRIYRKAGVGSRDELVTSFWQG
ncbi:MAG: helix-turn-helix transcriptional regulator [Olsenella sp.]|nr:helix-turn-helix transcriptional regulator [Olsenella sp.]